MFRVPSLRNVAVTAPYFHDGRTTSLATAVQIMARNQLGRELEAGESQRLEALGTLAGGIAHEFNNILGAMLGYGEMAQAASRKDSAARRYVGQIMKAGERAQNVVQQVLAFGRRREREHKPIRAEPVVAEAIELILPPSRQYRYALISMRAAPR